MVALQANAKQTIQCVKLTAQIRYIEKCKVYLLRAKSNRFFENSITSLGNCQSSGSTSALRDLNDNLRFVFVHDSCKGLCLPAVDRFICLRHFLRGLQGYKRTLASVSTNSGTSHLYLSWKTTSGTFCAKQIIFLLHCTLLVKHWGLIVSFLIVSIIEEQSKLPEKINARFWVKRDDRLLKALARIPLFHSNVY